MTKVRDRINIEFTSIEKPPEAKIIDPKLLNMGTALSLFSTSFLNFIFI